jgi:hypothetical protein
MPVASPLMDSSLISVPVKSVNTRSVFERMPSVMELDSESGLPMASTWSPTRSTAESPRVAKGRLERSLRLLRSILITLRSMAGSCATTWASSTSPVGNVHEMRSLSPTTW